MRGCAPSSIIRLRLRIRLLDRVYQSAVSTDLAENAGAFDPPEGHAASCAPSRGPMALLADSPALARHAGIARRDRLRQGLVAWTTTRRKIRNAVTGGHCKLQWKPDWRCAGARSRRYEMAGKDLIDSVKLSGEIARRSTGPPKASITNVPRDSARNFQVEGQWPDDRRMAALRQSEACPSSCTGSRARPKLYFDVIRAPGMSICLSRRLSAPDWKARLAIPPGISHAGEPPAGIIAHRPTQGTRSSACSNLAAVATRSPRALGFLHAMRRGQPETPAPRAMTLAVAYRDCEPKKALRAADEVEREARKSSLRLGGLPEGEAREIQTSFTRGASDSRYQNSARRQPEGRGDDGSHAYKCSRRGSRPRWSLWRFMAETAGR